jgi:transmembrane sensor
MIDERSREIDLIKSDARDWVAQLVSGRATAADAEALERWRRRSAMHEAAYVDALRQWQDLGQGVRAFVAARGAPTWSGRRERVTRRAILGGAGALAAAATAYAVIDPPLGLWPSFDELTADYRTATGEQRQLTVVGVAVEMNTQTSLAIAAAGGDMASVRLITGEAAFAMPQSARPLIVFAGDGRMVANQARFNVRNIGASVCVTCLDGEVQIERGTQRVKLGAGRQLIYGEAGLEPVAAVDPAEVTSWQDGYLVFRYTPLAAVVGEINRYRPGRVILLDPALGSKTFSGRFQIERINELLTWVEQATGTSARSLPGGVVLLS